MKSILFSFVLFCSVGVQAGILAPVCSAVNGRGMIFTAQAILNREAAQQAAMRKCYSVGSRVCRALGCR